MKTRQIVIALEGEEKFFPINAEKTIIGRDKSCDIQLDNKSVSRKHAAIIFRFEKIYIENISPSGQILKGGQATEYAELDENIEINIGPYILSWRFAESEASAQDHEDSPAHDQPMDESSNEDEFHFPQVMDAPIGDADEAHQIADFSPPATHDAALVSSEEAFSADEKTQVTDTRARPRLKIVRGEQDGREIKLDLGSSWTVGRSRKSHVHIDNPKISRQHFKIIKIRDKYRIQDLGSASGTKLNGVTVADAPLQPFDTIQAGPVEIQFLLADSAYRAVSSDLPVPSSVPAQKSENNNPFDQPNQNSTIVNVPVPYGSNDNTFTHPNDFVSHEAFQESPEASSASSDESDKPQSAIVAKIAPLKKWWDTQPPKKKLLYSSVAGVLFILLLIPSGQESPSASISRETASESPEAARIVNVARDPDISETFYALSLDRQNEIRQLYAEAERAANRKAWQEALDASNKILSRVDRYKDTMNIMLKAQSHLTEQVINQHSDSVQDAQTAARLNRERVQMFIESGTHALSERRWADAEESCVSALNLEPSNEEAQVCLQAARSRDAMAQGRAQVEPEVEIDPLEEMRQAEMEALGSLRMQYDYAVSQVRSSNFREALPVLEDLYGKLDDLGRQYQHGNRIPAALQGTFVPQVNQLKGQVRDAFENAVHSLTMEYQTLLADANQHINNRRYIQARQIYDQIIAREPYFDLVIEKRKELYTRIINQAKQLYRTALIYESIGDVRASISDLERAEELLTNVRDFEAINYLLKTRNKLDEIKR